MTTTSPTPIAPVVPSTGALRPLGLDAVSITGGFWAERQDVNRRATLAHIAHWLEREGWIRNFDLAASGALPAGRRGGSSPTRKSTSTSRRSRGSSGGRTTTISSGVSALLLPA